MLVFAILAIAAVAVLVVYFRTKSAKTEIGYLFLVLIALTLIDGCFVVLGKLTGMSTTSADVVVYDPLRTVADARKLIEDRRANPANYIYERDVKTFDAKDIAESLRLPGLSRARVMDDHVSLVLTGSKEWEFGARIWAADSRRIHKDEPTRYPDIYFFVYNSELPETPDNIR